MVDILYNKFENVRDKKDFEFNIGTSFDIEGIKEVVEVVETILEK